MSALSRNSMKIILNVINRYGNCVNTRGGLGNFLIVKRWWCDGVCWRCGAKGGGYFCDKCEVIQEVRERGNFFKVMGVEERFGVDSGVLTKRFRELQSRLHPDKFSNRCVRGGGGDYGF